MAEPRVRWVLRQRLEERRGEIEAAALTRVEAIAASSAAADPSYVEGLRAAVAAAIEYGLQAVERGEEHAPPLPVPLLGQARMAARAGVSLDTVLRRYFAGYSLLGYFMVEEASRDGLMSGAELQRLLGTQAVLFDRLLRAVSEEHTRETEAPCASSERKRAERIERLLDGELVDTTGIPYDFGGWHVGVVVAGSDARPLLRRASRKLNRALLAVQPAPDTIWAWLGGRRRLDPDALCDELGGDDLPCVHRTVGEPATGFTGWRYTHRQALAALPVAKRRAAGPVRYSRVALIAAALRDELLANSMRGLYLEPLERERDRGEALKQTLRAYLNADGSYSSAAAALGVSRRTVSNRVIRAEGLIGRPVADAVPDLSTALELDSLELADRVSQDGSFP